jgi:hypothetical protein
MKQLLVWLTTLLLALQLAPSTAHAVETAETALAGLTGGASAKLNYFGFHVYDAKLFVDKAKFAPKAPFEGRLALQISYTRALSGEKIAERSEAEMRALEQGSAEERAQWLAAMRKIFPNVKAGDVLIGAYAPGKSTHFYMNGKPIGQVDDIKFGAAFLNIWLSEKTSQPKLRASLLKGLDGR